MAGNYVTGDQVGSYSHSYFTTQQETYMGNVVAAQASATAWGHFRSRNKVIVSRVSLVCRSTPSATAGSLHVVYLDTGGSVNTLKTLTLASCTLGWATTLSFTGKTLSTLTEAIALIQQNTEKGDFDLVYEYQVLFDASASTYA